MTTPMKKPKKKNEGPKTRILTIVQGRHGEGFFESVSTELITYIHENDAEYRAEYMDSILRHFGIETSYDKTAKQKAALLKFERKISGEDDEN